MRARLVPFLLAMTVLASGCAGGGEPEVTAAPLPPASPSASPTATVAATEAGEVPAEAAAATPEGAAAFIRFFFGQLEVAYAQADPDLVATLSTTGCVTCDNYISSLQALREDAGSVSDYSIHVDSVEPSSVDEEGMLTAVVVLDVGKYVRRNADDRVTTREEPARGVVQDVSLVLTDGNWLVREITQ
jgi:hypothetical protein